MTEPVIDYQPRAQSFLRRRAPIVCLLVITLFGGVLRFWDLSKPALWGDEAATFSRVCGDYQDLIDILQYNGFVPLHYEIYNWIHAGMPMSSRIEYRAVEPIAPPRHGGFFANLATTKPTSQPTTKPFIVGEHPLVSGGVHMTPVVMRLVPAIAGTLMIPAMYFLAIQLTNRRAALIAALFTAGSAYMLVYSRDAKMYMHFWLCCTLSVACLLWWLRVRTRVAWLCWVAASVAMCGLHAPGAVLLGIELLIALSFDRDVWKTASVLAGTCLVIESAMWIAQRFSITFNPIIVAAIVVFLLIALCTFFAIRRQRAWLISTAFTLGLCVILSGIGGYYLSFNKFKERIEEDNWNVSMLQWVDEYNHGRDTGNLIAFPATAYLLSWEWAQPGEEPYVDPRALRLLHGAVYAIAAVLVLGLFRWKRRQSHLPGKPFGRRILWIIGWIVIPAYAFYCVSMGAQSTLIKGVWTPAYAAPNWWFVLLGQWLRTARWWLVLVAMVLAAIVFLSGQDWRERGLKISASLAAIVVIYALCGGAYLVINHLNRTALASNEHWHSLWMPRYLGIIWPAFAVVVASLLSRISTRALRYSAIAFVMAANFAQYTARLRLGEPPTDQIAADMLSTGSNRTYLLGRFVSEWGAKPGEGLYMSPAWRYYMAMLSNMKITPEEFRLRPQQRYITEFHPNLPSTSAMLGYDVRRSTQLSHITVWSKIDRGTADLFPDDVLRAQFGADWRKTSDQLFSGFDHWTWQKLYQIRRREYVRTGR